MTQSMLRRSGPAGCALGASLALFVTGCAAPAPAPVLVAAAPPPANQCFYAQSATGFTAVTDRLVHVRVGVRDVYAFELLGPCPEIDWAQTIAIESRGSSWICSGLDAVVVAPSTIGPQRCPVRSVVKLTDAQVAALPTSQRP